MIAPARSRTALYLAACILYALLPLAARAQTSSFAVATIHPSQESVQFEHDGRTDITPDSLRMQDVTLNTCIKFAYGVQDSQIDGPAWTKSDRYDIIAKTDGPVDPAQMKILMRSLIAERFHLAFHREPRTMKAFVLTVAKGGLKLTPAAAPDAPAYRQNSVNGTVVRSMTVQEWGDFISGPLQMPVVDKTGLTQKFDFGLDFTPYLPDPTKNMDGTRADTTSILTAAMSDELGLKMTAQRDTPVQVMILDQVAKPSPN